jgi:hypothetical protein
VCPQVEIIAFEARKRMGARAMTESIRRWGKIVELKQQLFFPREFYELLYVFERSARITGTPIFKEAVKQYHERGLGVVNLIDDIAVLLTEGT